MPLVDYSPLANAQPVNAGAAIAQGQALQANQFRLGEMQNAVDARAAQRAAASGAPGAQQSFEQNFPQEALKWSSDKLAVEKNKLGLELQKLQVLGQVAGGVNDQVSYDRSKQVLQQLGIDTSQMPPQFDPNLAKQSQAQALTVQQRLANLYKEFDRLQKQKKFEEDQRHNRAGEATAGRRASASERQAAAAERRAAAAEAKAKGEPTLKASDYNAMSARVADMFDGTIYDPLSGRIQGQADPARVKELQAKGYDAQEARRLARSEKVALITSIQERGAELMRTGEIKSPPEAAAAAAREAGINVKKLGGQKVTSEDTSPPQPGEKTATNPQTGEKAVFRGGKWVVLPK